MSSASADPFLAGRRREATIGGAMSQGAAAEAHRRSVESPDLELLAVALDRRRRQRRRACPGTERRHHRARDEEAGAKLLGELLDARGEIDGVADRGELLAPRRTDIAGHRLAVMQADADAQRPFPRGETLAIDLRQYVARR